MLLNRRALPTSQAAQAISQQITPCVLSTLGEAREGNVLSKNRKHIYLLTARISDVVWIKINLAVIGKFIKMTKCANTIKYAGRFTCHTRRHTHRTPPHTRSDSLPSLLMREVN